DHDHAEDASAKEDHGDDHDHDHDHDDTAEADDHGDDGDHDHAGHGHSQDPHAFLSTTNMALWASHIAAALSEADPENAETYRANAAAFAERARGWRAEYAATAPATPYAVYHSAYAYAEAELGMDHAAVLVTGHGAASAGHLSEVRETLIANDVTCVIVTAEHTPGIVDAAMPADHTSILLDEIGRDIPAGPDMIRALYASIPEAVASCE
ncbi:MAG: metal ABC transporter solute-binding protein, Zn/Mn family, partial [Shimia sp.]